IADAGVLEAIPGLGQSARREVDPGPTLGPGDEKLGEHGPRSATELEHAPTGRTGSQQRHEQRLRDVAHRVPIPGFAPPLAPPVEETGDARVGRAVTLDRPAGSLAVSHRPNDTLRVHPTE